LPHQADQGPTPFRPLPGPTRRPAPPPRKKKSPPPGPPPGPPAGPSPGSRPGSRPGSQPPGLSSSRRPSPPAPVAARRRVVVDASGTERSSVDAGPVTFEYVQRLVKLTRRGLSLREAVEKLREVGGEVPLSVGEAIDMLRELGSDAPHSVREAIDMLRDLGSDAPHSVKELVDILRRGIAAGGGRRSSPSSQPPPAVDDDDRGKAALAAAVPTAIVLRRPLPWLRPLRTLCLRPTRLFRRTAGARRATRRMRPSLGRLRGRARRRRPGPRR
jgi:hypothetical protein